jgi:hypothetical protein
LKKINKRREYQKSVLETIFKNHNTRKTHLQEYIFFEMPQRTGIATFYVTKALFLKDYA